MRLQDFWDEMRAAFGPLTDSFARDYVMAELGDRTALEALRDGFSAREVWGAVVRSRELQN
jgi:hypothetical protein